MSEQTPKATILLVDDDQEVLDLYTEILVDAGYAVDKVLNGQEALAACEVKKYDLILLDLMMPVMDGIETLKHLRADEAKYGHPIVVALTNVTMAVNVREAFEYGADGYLVKLSVSNDLLVDKVRGYLEGFGKKESPVTQESPPPTVANPPASEESASELTSASEVPSN